MTFRKDNDVYTVKQALDKAYKYCALQDRCQSEMITKLKSWNLSEDEAAEVLIQLITEQFVNDERFARSFVRGKFNQNGWGRVKITYALRQKEISTQCINMALEEIDDEKYHSKLIDIATKKWNITSAKNDFEKKNKVAGYLVSRGFESNLIWDTLNNLEHDN